MILAIERSYRPQMLDFSFKSIPLDRKDPNLTTKNAARKTAAFFGHAKEKTKVKHKHLWGS